MLSSATATFAQQYQRAAILYFSLIILPPSLRETLRRNLSTSSNSFVDHVGLSMNGLHSA